MPITDTPTGRFARSAETLNTVIFDLDDTLICWRDRSIDWETFHQPLHEAWLARLAEQGLAQRVELDEWKTAFKGIIQRAWTDARKTWIAPGMYKTLRQTLAAVGYNPDDVDIDALIDDLPWGVCPGVTLFDDTLHVLTTLRERGFRIGLITNAWQPMPLRDHELRDLGLIDSFDARITSGDTGFIKPHPAVYWRMLGMLDSAPEKSLMVGDHPQFDIKGANLTGMLGAFVDRPYLERDEDNVTIDYRISELSALLEILPATAAA